MGIESLIRVALGAGAERLFQHGLRLEPGDRLELKVLEVRADQRALVGIGGVRVMAEVAFPVRAGEVLTAEVIGTEGQLRLGVVKNPAVPGEGAPPVRPPQAGTMETLAQARRDLAQVLLALERLTGAEAGVARQSLWRLAAALAPLPLDDGAAALADRLRAHCLGSGLFFEKRLGEELARQPEGAAPSSARELTALPGVARIMSADLKALLAEAGNLLGRGDTPLAGFKESAALARSVEALMSEIGRGQENAGRRPAEAEPFQMVHFTLPLGGEGSRAALKIGFRRPSAAASRDGSRAALLLELDRLGTTRVDLFALERSLSVTFFVNGTAARQAVESQAAELRSALAAQFDDVRVEVHVSRKKIDAFETEDLRPAEGRRVDVHA